MNEITIDFTEATRQAGLKADDYLSKAYRILKEDYGYEDWTVRDAIELAKIMAQDFNTTATCIKMQEIRDAIHDLTNAISEQC
jgi:hypothetical protein